jgi:hypothetical protein
VIASCGTKGMRRTPRALAVSEHGASLDRFERALNSQASCGGPLVTRASRRGPRATVDDDPELKPAVARMGSLTKRGRR